MTVQRQVTGEDFHADELLRDGTFDSAALLVLWLVRKLFLPALFLGLIVAVLVTRDVDNLGAEIERSIDSLATPEGFLRALASPFALIIAALVLRLVVEVLALALTYPLMRWGGPSDYSRGGVFGSHIRLWMDRVHLTASLRSLRWSWAVRQAAADRLGHAGRVLEALSPLLSWVAALLFVLLVWVIATTG